MKLLITEAEAIIEYVPTSCMEWGEIWAEKLVDRFCEVLTGDVPSTVYKMALWCNSYMDAVAVKTALIDEFSAHSIICSDELGGWVVLTMKKRFRYEL